jgi:hypothetical protein
MKVTILILVLTSIFTFVQSSPINCDSGNSYMGSILEVESFHTQEVDEKCKNADVCVYPCNKIIPNCNKNVYFSDFLSKIPQEGLQTVAESYLGACIQRKFEGPTKEFWMKSQLLKLVSIAVETMNPATKPQVNAGMSYSDIVQKLVSTNEHIFVYLARMSELLLTLDKMCQQNETWKKDLKLKIVDLMDSDTTDLRTHFSGNKFLLNIMIGRYNSAVKAKLAYDGAHKTVDRHKFHSLKKKFKLNYLRNAENGDSKGYLCRCDYFIRGDVTKYYSGALDLVKKQCGVVCPATSSKNLKKTTTTKTSGKVVGNKKIKQPTKKNEKFSKKVEKKKMVEPTNRYSNDDDLSEAEEDVIDKIAKKFESEYE